jgi:hypothetical protein
MVIVNLTPVKLLSCYCRLAPPRSIPQRLWACAIHWNRKHGSIVDADHPRGKNSALVTVEVCRLMDPTILPHCEQLAPDMHS